METRSNYVIVGFITFILLGSLLAFTVWLAGYSDGAKKEYDIFFRSVSGINKGASVAYSGVSVGQVTDVGLWRDPEFVRVRISVDEQVPILEGTVATISGIGFTGVSELQLSGGLRGAAPLLCPEDNPESTCPDGVPIIPTKPGALGELLNSAPVLVERLSTLTDRMTTLLSDENQASLENILVNVDRLTGSLANQTGDIGNTISQSKQTLVQAEQTLQSITALTEQTSGFIDNNGNDLVKDLKLTLKTARTSLKALEDTVQNANPSLETLHQKTIPEANKLLLDLQQLSNSLNSVTDKLDQQGAGALLGPPPLPDYEPTK